MSIKRPELDSKGIDEASEYESDNGSQRQVIKLGSTSRSEIKGSHLVDRNDDNEFKFAHDI